MDEYKKFLSDRLLSEERPITYRLLSRALDVHVNTAKEMLYDYHKSQNEQRADSVHATYLVYGIRAPEKADACEDIEMKGETSENEALPDVVNTTTLTVAREEELTDILAQYKQVSSIHVYSLAPHPQRNLSLLAEVSTQLSEYPQIEDISAAAQKYGTIPNPQVRRRDRKSPPQILAPETKPVKQEPAAAKPAGAKPTIAKLVFAPKVKQEQAASKPSTTDAKPANEEESQPASRKEAPTSSVAKKALAPKKAVSGGIMQSFAKAAAKAPKPKPAPKKEEEDTAMALSDDGEADEIDLPAKKSTADSGAIKKARKEREDALRRMMEEDDDEEEEEEEEEEAEASEKDEEPADEEMEEAPEPEPEPKEEPAEVVSSSGNGRRRGKRRVMKKKRILDDQGYMVTIQEPGWESFSEDEAPPAKKPAWASTQSQSSTPSSSAGKAKKAAPKGQGNIMSFFLKK